MKTFIEFLLEAIRPFHEDRILTNPSKAEFKAQYKNSQRQTIRFLHNTSTNDIHTGDGWYHDHTDIADATGESKFNDDYKSKVPRVYDSHKQNYIQGEYKAGVIHSGNFGDVIKHPKGIKGYANDIAITPHVGDK